MKRPDKNPGYGNGGKTNCVFPPFPQPLLLVINQDEAVDPKQLTIVYTKYLTLPLFTLFPFVRDRLQCKDAFQWACRKRVF